MHVEKSKMSIKMFAETENVQVYFFVSIATNGLKLKEIPQVIVLIVFKRN